MKRQNNSYLYKNIFANIFSAFLLETLCSAVQAVLPVLN